MSNRMLDWVILTSWTTIFLKNLIKYQRIWVYFLLQFPIITCISAYWANYEILPNFPPSSLRLLICTFWREGLTVFKFRVLNFYFVQLPCLFLWKVFQFFLIRYLQARSYSTLCLLETVSLHQYAVIRPLEFCPMFSAYMKASHFLSFQFIFQEEHLRGKASSLTNEHTPS